MNLNIFYQPCNHELRTLYQKTSVISIDAKTGDILEIGGQRYIVTDSGLEIMEHVLGPECNDGRHCYEGERCTEQVMVE